VFDAVKTITPLFNRNPRFELFSTGTFPAYSPDQRHILLAGGFGPVNTLKLINADGSDYHTVFTAPKDAWILSPSWSPDGKTIALSIGGFFARPVQPGQIALVDADGSNLRTLTHGDASSGFPSISPDGKKLVYRIFGTGEQGLRIMNLSDGSVTKLTNAWDNFPAWSPRGDRIVFTGFHTGDFEIYTIRPDGTDLRQLTRDHGNDAHASWSPDGQWIVFSSSRTGWKDEGFGSDQSYGEICIMRENGSDVQQLTDNQYEEATPTWLPHTMSIAGSESSN
jgi:Tol biopolymer transport system component